MRSESSTTSRLLLVAAAVLFSSGGAAIKATTLASWQVACFRSAVAGLALAVFLPGARRGWSRRVLPVGIAYAVTLVLYVLATKLTTAANAIFLQGTAPLYLLLAGPWLLGERIRRSDLLFMAPVLTGLVLFFAGSEAPLRTAPDPALGNVLAAITGVTWAVTLGGLRVLGRRAEGSLATVVAGNAIAFAAALPMALPVSRVSFADAATLVYLGVFQIGLAYVCLTRGVKRVPAFEASMILLLEPALNPVWTWLVHGEKPAVLPLIGGALIFGSTVASTLWQSRGITRRI